MKGFEPWGCCHLSSFREVHEYVPGRILVAQWVLFLACLVQSQLLQGGKPQNESATKVLLPGLHITASFNFNPIIGVGVFSGSKNFSSNLSPILEWGMGGFWFIFLHRLPGSRTASIELTPIFFFLNISSSRVQRSLHTKF
jgi:hypothetical protein